MAKIDNLFLKIISDEQLTKAYNINPNKYRDLDAGKRAIEPSVRAIAEMVDLLNKKINDVKSDMRIRNQVGPVILDDAVFQSIYKKVVSTLSK